jgi:hypothetical protein
MNGIITIISACISHNNIIVRSLEKYSYVIVQNETVVGYNIPVGIPYFDPVY